MALIFAAVVAVGALNASSPASAVAPDTPWTAQAPACQTARITARAALVYKPDGSNAPVQDKAVVVTMEQVQRSLDAGPAGATPADAVRGASTAPARLLICAPGHQDREAGA